MYVKENYNSGVYSILQISCKYHPSRTNSKISYTFGNWHASLPLWRETAATGPSFLAPATSDWPACRLQDILGAFGYWSEFVFPSSCSTRPEGAPLQGTPRCEPPPKKTVCIFVEGCEILNKLPATSLQLLLSIFSRNGWRQFGQKSFPTSPVDWTLTFFPPHSPTPPPYHLHTTH